MSRRLTIRRSARSRRSTAYGPSLRPVGPVSASPRMICRSSARPSASPPSGPRSRPPAFGTWRSSSPPAGGVGRHLLAQDLGAAARSGAGARGVVHQGRDRVRIPGGRHHTLRRTAPPDRRRSGGPRNPRRARTAPLRPDRLHAPGRRPDPGGRSPGRRVGRRLLARLPGRHDAAGTRRPVSTRTWSSVSSSAMPSWNPSAPCSRTPATAAPSSAKAPRMSSASSAPCARWASTDPGASRSSRSNTANGP